MQQQNIDGIENTLPCSLHCAQTTNVGGGSYSGIWDGSSTISPDTFTRLDGYLDNLATAATTERSTLAQLIETNAMLTTNIATLTTSVASLTAAYTILAAATNTSQTPATRRKRSGGTTANKTLAVGGYCWTHGYRVRKGHDGVTCKNKAEGHKDVATRANTMNGSTANKGWEDT